MHVQADALMKTIRQQIHNNAVALISLFIAVSALAYNTWRNETTEDQRNIRHAAFRVIENLGELQEVVDTRYYYLAFEQESSSEGELRIRGFGNVNMARDLMMLMPEPGPAAGVALYDTWQLHFASLDELDNEGRHTPEATDAEREIHQAIGHARQAVLNVLHSLD
jgi:hypothetical protein